MKISDVQDKQLIVIYPGRFQLWHKGHKAVLDKLIAEFSNADVYIATSNKTEPDRSPFTFEEKKQIMKFTGVNSNRIVETKQPYRANEITQKYDPDKTVAIYAIGTKDMKENPRFNLPKQGIARNKDGSPSYFQRWTREKNDSEPLNKHGYIHTIGHYSFDVLDKKVSSSTELRNMFKTLNDSNQKQFMMDLFGNYSPEIQQLLISKLS